MVDVPYGSVEGDREAVAVDGIAQHGFHVGIIGIRLVVGELPYYQTAYFAEQTAQAELIENAFDFVYRFGDVFDKQDCVGFEDVVRRIDKLGKYGKVSTS